ncbi:MAG: glycosyltransferase family 2 protein [Microthrixaceae bacterium]
MRHRVTAPAPGREPTVSVVVPCYNYGHFLEDCIRSIVEQPGVVADVLVIDDASPDGSGDVAEALADRYPRVRVIRHLENRGHIATYNEGLPQAEGDYVVLLSADDQLTPGALGRATALMEAHPEVGLVYGHPVSFSDTPPPARTEVGSWSVWAGERWIRAQLRRGLSIIYSPEAVVRTSVHREVGWYRPELPHTGDLEMWLRVAAEASVGRVNGADQAFRRVHPQSMMRTQFGTPLRDLEGRLDAITSFLRTSRARLDSPGRLDALARRVMAGESLDLACALVASGAGQDDAGAGPEDYVTFAATVWPRYRRLPGWREYRLRSGNGPSGPVVRAELGALAARRDLAGRIRWQRWHRLGL